MGHFVRSRQPSGTLGEKREVLTSVRAIFEALGVKDVVAKSIGSSNPHNMIKATFDGLEHVHAPRQVAAKRGKKVGEIIGRRDATTAEPKEQ